METNQNPSEEPKSFFQSNTAKMIMVGFLTLVLLIPLAFVSELINERNQRHLDVISETTSKWGEDITIYGPIIKVPYYDSTQKKYLYAYFFPNELINKSNSKMEPPLERSIYKSNVFSTQMKMTGKFGGADFSKMAIAESNIYWDKARIILSTNSLKGLKEETKITIAGKTLTFEPNSNGDDTNIIETSFINFKEIAQNQSFSVSMTINGSNRINIIPIGKTSTITMKSDWNSPSFGGFQSPVTRKVTSNGFTATWKVLHFNRSFAQEHFGKLPNLDQYGCQTEFITPVDEYQQNERAAKYGFLVIGLTFLIFFLIQAISKISIHIFQYTMIGIALVMFYTLLISITEHSSFTTAYLIAGSSVVAMITFYSVSILKDRKFPIFIGAALTLLYSFIYVIIQLEDYALLVGSIGLFLILAAVMYFSRKIEWNK